VVRVVFRLSVAALTVAIRVVVAILIAVVVVVAVAAIAAVGRLSLLSVTVDVCYLETKPKAGTSFSAFDRAPFDRSPQFFVEVYVAR
jgi:hypothetical protein